jgi:flagellum-specific ATP synthase
MTAHGRAEDLLRVQRYEQVIQRTVLAKSYGRVMQVVGLTIESRGPSARIGDVCLIHLPDEARVACEVVGFRGDRVLLMPLSDVAGLAAGCPVEATGQRLRVGVGQELLGRVVDGLGQPLDGLPAPRVSALAAVDRDPPSPLSRPRIRSPFATGVRVIDGLLTLGRGQRIGLFAGSGVGKSTLLGMIARGSEADVTVIALVGERGREVREFLERDLADARSRAVVVVATSDRPALARIKAALTATAIAEHFRDQGLDVLFMMDSVTRYAMALREIGLAVGEPPTARGYTPSVFAALPKLLERAGLAERGSITGVYSVLVDGDDLQDPITDAVRGILDGHIVLARELANRGHYPAVDALASVSRLMSDVASAQHRADAAQLRAWLAAKRDIEDLVRIGAYQRGTDPVADQALEVDTQLTSFLRQTVDEQEPLDVTVNRVHGLAGGGAA